MRYLAPDFVVRSFLDITPEDVRELSPDSLAICVDIDGTVTDFHAPEAVRGVQPGRNMDAFYEAFDIEPDEPMFLPPEDRIVIW